MTEREKLEQQISNAKTLVAHRDMALKLGSNREFRKLVLEEYLVNEAARLIQLAGDPRLTKEQRQDAEDMAKATGHFKRWLTVVQQMGDAAANDIGECEEALVELDAAELDGDDTQQVDSTNHASLEG